MFATAILLAVCCAGVAEQVPTAVAQGLLDSAAEKAWRKPDPRYSLKSILWTAFEIDPDRACGRAQAMSDRVVALGLPPVGEIWHAPFARLAAPHDRELRDLLLRRAGAEAKAALATAALWIAPPPDPAKGHPYGDPQRLLDEQKRLLAFNARLWQAMLQAGADRLTAVVSVNQLLADANAAGSFGACVIRTYGYDILEELANFDPDLLLDPKLEPGEEWGGRDAFAKFCGQEAQRRWSNQHYDAFTGKLATHAANNGYPPLRIVGIYKHYDLLRAVALAATEFDTMPYPASRESALLVVIGDFARANPDAALALAEKQENADLRRDAIQSVSSVWAIERPEQIERAIRNQDNAVRRGWARDAAKKELLRRSQGVVRQPPPAFRAWSAAELRVRGNPEEIRILDNPNDTAWLTGHNRGVFLGQAAMIALRENGIAGVNRIVSGLRDSDEIDAVLCYVAQRTGPQAIGTALELLGRVKSDGRYVVTACLIAKQLGRRPEPTIARLRPPVASRGRYGLLLGVGVGCAIVIASVRRRVTRRPVI